MIGSLGIYGLTKYFRYNNERAVFFAIQRGTYPELSNDLITRELIIDDLKNIFLSPYDYHLIVGEHGTGKTTVVIQSATEFGSGVVYIQGSNKLDEFSEAFADALG